MFLVLGFDLSLHLVKFYSYTPSVLKIVKHLQPANPCPFADLMGWQLMFGNEARRFRGNREIKTAVVPAANLLTPSPLFLPPFFQGVPPKIIECCENLLCIFRVLALEPFLRYQNRELNILPSKKKKAYGETEQTV